jgi:dTDP-4-dehydrorhamnose reductase
VILVFGGNGQLGRELARSAAERAQPLMALSRAGADIAESTTVAAAIARYKPTLVVNAAAYTKVDLAESNVEAARRGNTLGPATVAAACAEGSIPLVHISTDYVFDGSKTSAYVETDPVRPLSVYGRTKADGEEAVRRAMPRHVILRTAWLYSEFGENFLKTMLRLAATRDELRVVADQHGSPTSARTLAEAILHTAPRLRRDGSASNAWGTYHLTADGIATWHGFAARIVAAAAPITGRHPRVIAIGTADYPTPARRPSNSGLDCRLFARTFGWSAPHWTEEVDRTTRTLAAAAPESAERRTDRVA